MLGKNPPRPGGAERAWNLGEIKDLLDLLIEREITEFEMERSGVRIRVRRGNAHVEAVFPSGSAPTMPPLPMANPLSPPAPTLEESSAAETTEELHVIKSPIVGTFYAAPAPNAPPFVTMGDVVQVGQVLCIIEAMKLMNEIESEVAGEVVRVYVENGQPVEYGQSLFAIKPSYKK